MRSILKEWKNGPYLPKWTARIRWYEDRIQGINEERGVNVKLEMTDCERIHIVLPADLESAKKIWFMFTQGAPPQGQSTPFIMDLIELIRHPSSGITLKGS